jgi:hypothetical protein
MIEHELILVGQPGYAFLVEYELPAVGLSYLPGQPLKRTREDHDAQ